jgi:hypothetical protein
VSRRPGNRNIGADILVVPAHDLLSPIAVWHPIQLRRQALAELSAGSSVAKRACRRKSEAQITFPRHHHRSLQAPLGFLAGTLIESRKENNHLTSVIRSLPYSLQAPALLQSHGGGVFSRRFSCTHRPGLRVLLSTK